MLTMCMVLLACTNHLFCDVQEPPVVQNITCQYTITNESWTLKLPHYYIFNPQVNGKSCICPDMYVHGSWDNVTWGSLYQPEKSTVRTKNKYYDMCMATNCYTLGFTDLDKVYNLTQNVNNNPSCPSGKDLVVYQGVVKSKYSLRKVQTQQYLLLKNYSWAISNYDYAISQIDTFIYSWVENCYISNSDGVNCKYENNILHV